MTENKKILYVEDHEDTANVVKLILGVIGFEVDIALDGNEGLQKLTDNTYDLVIFDIMLPDISGLDLFEKTRNMEKNKNTKYVFLSITHVPEEKKKLLKEKGVLGFIPKPFKKEELVKNIHEALQGKEINN